MGRHKKKPHPQAPTWGKVYYNNARQPLMYGWVCIVDDETTRVNYPLRKAPRFTYDLLCWDSNQQKWYYMCSTNRPDHDRNFRAFIDAAFHRNVQYVVVHAETGRVFIEFLDGKETIHDIDDVLKPVPVPVPLNSYGTPVGTGP